LEYGDDAKSQDELCGRFKTAVDLRDQSLKEVSIRRSKKHPYSDCFRFYAHIEKFFSKYYYKNENNR
jgi:hypothetical protein